MAFAPQALTRRALIGAAPLLVGLPTALQAAPRALTFAVFRNGQKIGEHAMTFTQDGTSTVARSDVAMSVRLGPVPVYKYRHSATERWQDDRFASLETSTNGNGKRQTVSAEATRGGVLIQTLKGSLRAAADTSPLTHWNPRALRGPLFNPQDGKLLKVQVAQAGPGHWTIRGDAEIDDFYDAAGVWKSLRGRLEDGSQIEYRRA